MQRRLGQVRSLAYQGCAFIHSADNESEPNSDRRSLTFTMVYRDHVDISDFRKGARANLVLIIRRSHVRSLVGSQPGTNLGTLEGASFPSV